MKRPSRFDVTVAGLAVVDVIGKPVDLRHPPRAGELRYLDSVTMTSGGNVCNCGIDLAKLGLRVAAIARVGSDGLGTFLASRLAASGIDCRGLIVDGKKQTSATFVAVDRGGERTFLHTRGCLENFRAADVLSRLDVIGSSKMFVLGYYGLLPEAEPEFGTLLREVKRRTGVLVLVDTGGTPRRRPRELRAFLPWVDYFIPSEEEAVAVTGRRKPEEIVRALFDAGVASVAGVKLGSRGCYIAFNGEASYVPSVRVRSMVDATGAGDAFVAGFTAATLKGFDPFAAAGIANRVAASCVTAIGASTAVGHLGRYVRKL